MERRKQKVAHLTSVHIPSDTRILYRECATLAEAGYDVVLVASAGDVALPPGVRYHAVPRPRNRFERMTKTIWRVYRAALAERADVYHFHDPELMGVGLLLRAHARVVFDVHEDIPDDIAEKSWIAPVLRAPVSAAAAMALRALQRGYDAVVTATPAIARRFAHRRTIVVHNYPRPDELPMVAPLAFAQRPRRAVYLGNISALRCVQTMVAAMARPQTAGMRLRLAGSFDDPTLEAQMRRAPGWERIDFTGYCARHDVPAALGEARAGLLLFRAAANHEEALPNKLFEYLGAGLPVIISRTLRASAIVEEHGCGLVVDPDDPGAIAVAIARLIDDPEEAQRMGERGSALVKEQYQWTSEAQKLTRLYAEIA